MSDFETGLANLEELFPRREMVAEASRPGLGNENQALYRELAAQVTDDFRPSALGAPEAPAPEPDPVPAPTPGEIAERERAGQYDQILGDGFSPQWDVVGGRYIRGEPLGPE